ncbi:uncharacterized protein LOC119111532 [Pollicipes pollicipes]|uniref:uncharacterized protein LOC119111532 n=1 Tax=Pollicipes pollicipes TaxID=41117 RepID=UPI0018854289|nr:uncharacterized protein LOC119111532 [Pollicipes pollicipes]
MKNAGSLLLVLVAAVCVVSVHPMPAEPLPSESEPSSSGGLFGLASLDALTERIHDWTAPLRDLFMETVQNKTVSEVAIEARNATVNFAVRVKDMEAVQSAKDAISPVVRMFEQVRDSVKDKTLQQLADEVKTHLVQLDRTVASFIRDLRVI